MNPETTVMLRNVILHAREHGTKDAEILANVAAELFKDTPAEPAKPAPKPVYKHDIATGPAVAWKAPVGGFYRYDGRFVKDETWAPVEKPAEQEREYSTPDILAQTQRTGNTGSHLGTAKDGRMADLNATGGACKVEWQEPTVKGGSYQPYGMSGQTRWVPDE